MLWTCYGEVANLLRSCYGETGVMDCGLYRADSLFTVSEFITVAADGDARWISWNSQML